MAEASMVEAKKEPASSISFPALLLSGGSLDNFMRRTRLSHNSSGVDDSLTGCMDGVLQTPVWLTPRCVWANAWVSVPCVLPSCIQHINSEYICVQTSTLAISEIHHDQVGKQKISKLARLLRASNLPTHQRSVSLSPPIGHLRISLTTERLFKGNPPGRAATSKMQ
jgi:hypothetical protein